MSLEENELLPSKLGRKIVFKAVETHSFRADVSAHVFGGNAR